LKGILIGTFDAIKPILNMVLISIHPFALRKLFLFIVAFLCFSALCLADPVLMVRRYSVRPDRTASLKNSAQASEQFFSSENVLFAGANATYGEIAPISINHAAKPGGFRLREVSHSGLRNPACVRRLSISSAEFPDEPAALGLRKI
jgi:hypothetical protein